MRHEYRWTMTSDELITILEAAELLGLSGGEFGNLVDNGTLEVRRDGRRLLVERKAVNALLTDQGTA